jgi:FtsH-binding integral membrane protein
MWYNPGDVMTAAVLTLAVMIGLCIYAAKTKEDYTVAHGVFVVLFICMFGLFLWLILFPNPSNILLYICLGAFVFGLCIVANMQ